MRKEQLLAAIKERIYMLPPYDIAKSLDYYSEMIDDRMEDGMTEEEAVAALGSVDEIVSQILADASLPSLMKASVGRRAPEAWEIVLLVLGSPIWLSLLLAAVIVVISVYIVIWSVAASLYITDISVFASGLLMAARGVVELLAGESLQSLMTVGIGFVAMGAAILLFIACGKLCVGLAKLSRLIFSGIKAIFVRRVESK